MYVLVNILAADLQIFIYVFSMQVRFILTYIHKNSEDLSNRLAWIKKEVCLNEILNSEMILYLQLFQVLSKTGEIHHSSLSLNNKKPN